MANCYSPERDSFKRICDDLCEEILTHLSFNDKIAFECVSQQFMDCVFKRQKVLVLNRNKDCSNSLNKLLTRDNILFFGIKSSTFKSVLKKVAINYIEIVCDTNTDELLWLMAHNCTQLT